MTALAHTDSSTTVHGTVISSSNTKTRVWVPAWKKVITVKHLEPQNLNPGKVVSIQWYDTKEKPRWKERIVFRLEEKQTL